MRWCTINLFVLLVAGASVTDRNMNSSLPPPGCASPCDANWHAKRDHTGGKPIIARRTRSAFGWLWGAGETRDRFNESLMASNRYLDLGSRSSFGA
jgi:hypothetical protein